MSAIDRYASSLNFCIYWLFKNNPADQIYFFYKGSTRTLRPTKQWGAVSLALKPQRYEAEHPHQNRESCNEHLAFTKQEEHADWLRNYLFDKKEFASCKYFVN